YLSPERSFLVGLKMYEPYKKHFPWLIPCFVLANIGLFIFSMYINDCPSTHGSNHCIGVNTLGRFAFQSLKVNPLLGPSSDTLVSMGALDVQRVVKKHEVWRLLTCMWLHAGVFHVMANMFSLVFVGIRLEQEFGCLKVGLLYIISGIGGSLLSALFVHDTISVGASGALFGLLGGMLSELLTNWTIYANKLAALMTLITIIIINLAVGILPHVDNFAHLGGFFSGFLLGFVFLLRPQYAYEKQRHDGFLGKNKAKSKYKKYQFLLLVISLLLLITGFASGIYLLIRGVNGNDHCSWCHYLSCVPTPIWSCKREQYFCESITTDTQLTLKCKSNGRSKVYHWPLPDNTSSELGQLCSQLCS
ncbi:RHOMBOID-like protein 1, partial [Impatiens glandulifera]|uniref:RHOMBOID-like protein 1 n=1 Tax=Impatiens glandulifera TaxID=253017 RepID=UPI001FB0CCA2